MGIKKSIVFILTILLFINYGLVYLLVKYRSNADVFWWAIMALIIIDGLSLFAVLHVCR
jgi:hypothetical protein